MRALFILISLIIFAFGKQQTSYEIFHSIGESGEEISELEWSERGKLTLFLNTKESEITIENYQLKSEEIRKLESEVDTNALYRIALILHEQKEKDGEKAKAENENANENENEKENEKTKENQNENEKEKQKIYISSSVPLCALQQSGFKDKIVLNLNEKGEPIQLGYFVDVSDCFLYKTDLDQNNQNNQNNQKNQKNQKNQIDFVAFQSITYLNRPYEAQGPSKLKYVKDDGTPTANVPEQSFFSKYWYHIVIVCVMFLFGSSLSTDDQQQQQQQQQQQKSSTQQKRPAK